MVQAAPEKRSVCGSPSELPRAWNQRPTGGVADDYHKEGRRSYKALQEDVMASQTLTALYNEAATAEEAVERLRALGIPEQALEMHPAADGDILPGNAPSGGLFSIGDILGDRGEEGTASGTIVVAFRVPEDLVARATSILKEHAIEVDRGRDSA